MLKIKALRIEVFTVDGKYGRDIVFGDGLNIIYGNNTSGKSTCVQAILHGLGMEELLGGKAQKLCSPF
ncbi:AAA family ATPase [Spirosoma rhododendri]|uniref:AAA family ATPase n=1 Tax=Spirosoma rhododendri TaxID=2728024 RepID=A0A7L5DQ38_9BACT|nr:AAA family ATPase [Spirosoma rhododendri]